VFWPDISAGYLRLDITERSIRSTEVSESYYWVPSPWVASTEAHALGPRPPEGFRGLRGLKIWGWLRLAEGTFEANPLRAKHSRFTRVVGFTAHRFGSSLRRFLGQDGSLARRLPRWLERDIDARVLGQSPEVSVRI
jgi:hypothetical protein